MGGASDKGVGARAAGDVLAAPASQHRLIAAAADDRAAAHAAQDRAVSTTQVNVIVAVRELDEIAPSPSENRIVADSEGIVVCTDQRINQQVGGSFVMHARGYGVGITHERNAVNHRATRTGGPPNTPRQSGVDSGPWPRH